MDTSKWNIAFTNLIRQTQGTAWGNWTLNPSVRPGAVGFIDPDTGSFTYVTDIPQPKIVNLASPQTWSVESSSVHRSENNVDFKGGYVDPSTGNKVDVGLEVAWTFAHENSVSSNATLTGLSVVDDFGALLQSNFQWMLGEAASVDKVTRDANGKPTGIVQGFGMITHATRCAGGINLGALNDSSTFSLTGSVDGVGAMTGVGDVTAGIKGSFKQTDENKSMEKRLWPAEADKASTSEVAIAYQFASFDGHIIMPTWIQPLSGFSFVFDNAHAGTYIAHCKVEFESASNPSMSPVSITVPGGQCHSINGIPLDAKNLVVTIHLVAGDTFTYRYASPIATILNGTVKFDIYGVWPWSAHVDVS